MLIVFLISSALGQALGQDFEVEEADFYDNTHHQQEANPFQPDDADVYYQEDRKPKANATATWEKMRKRLKWDTEEPKPNPEEEKKKKDKLNSFSGDHLAEAFRWILIMFGVIAIIGLLVYLFQGNTYRRSNKIEIDISEEQIDWIEENLPDAEVESVLQAAIDAKAYRKAIRLYFLLIIQRLTIKGHIDWKKDKTNRIYLAETAQRPYAATFGSCVRIYERVWYGERPVGEQEFQGIAPIYQNLADSLQTQPRQKDMDEG